MNRIPHVPTSKRTEKLQIMLDDEELKVIDDWRFEHRMPTRAAAIRELIRRGLIAEDIEEPDTEGKSTTDFRIEPE
jgi:metal-responsive CopG/Arc/MetJ family transcriptional regulator